MSIYSEQYMRLLDMLPKDIKNIPKPWFTTTLFPEVELAICRPLFPPFDHLAITHYGEIFQHRPLMTTTFYDSMRVIDPMSVLIPKQGNTDRNYVTLQNFTFGLRKNFFVDRLVLDRFLGIGILESVVVEHLDGVNSNDHISNLDFVKGIYGKG